jgi:hypothetical protein
MHLQVKETLALAKGDLDEAEIISAEDKLAISEADENPSTEEEPATKSKPKKGVEDSILVDIRKKFADAQAELASVRNSLATAEPATERTTFCDWVREVCKNASDDQFVEFQTISCRCRLNGRSSSARASCHAAQLKIVLVYSLCPLSGECHLHISRMYLLGRVSLQSACSHICNSLTSTLLPAFRVLHVPSPQHC